MSSPIRLNLERWHTKFVVVASSRIKREPHSAHATASLGRSGPWESSGLRAGLGVLQQRRTRSSRIRPGFSIARCRIALPTPAWHCYTAFSIAGWRYSIPNQSHSIARRAVALLSRLWQSYTPYSIAMPLPNDATRHLAMLLAEHGRYTGTDVRRVARGLKRRESFRAFFFGPSPFLSVTMTQRPQGA